MRAPFAIFFAAAFLAAVPGTGCAEGKRPVRLLLQWLPQAQFAGYYVAEADGLYRSAGLEVELLHATAKQDTLAELAAGRCDYATGWLASALLKTVSGVDIVSVAQFQQGSSLAIVARRAAGINRIEDLNNRNLVLWLAPTSRRPLLRMLDARHVMPAAVLPMLSEPDLFFRGAADAIGCMMYGEYRRLIMAGFEPDELVVFKVSDVFPDFADDGLYALRPTYARSPETAQALRQATMEGWRRAFAKPDRALALVERQMHQAALPYPIVRQREMLADIRAIIDRPGNDGRLRRASFDSTLSILGLTPVTGGFARFAPQGEGVK